MNHTVICLDFDETLMNTDRLRADLLKEITQLGGETLAAAYQHAYEETRSEHGVPHLPLVLKNLLDKEVISKETLYTLTEVFHTFPYQEYLYPGAEQVVRFLIEQGTVLLFSDGNAFFQTQKIHATSVKELVDSIIVLPNKINAFEELCGYWPAERYVFIDDKQKVLDAAKTYFGETAITILVKQGRYAQHIDSTSSDFQVQGIADIINLVY